MRLAAIEVLSGQYIFRVRWHNQQADVGWYTIDANNKTVTVSTVLVTANAMRLLGWGRD